jgi:hypothetical protein
VISNYQKKNQPTRDSELTQAVGTVAATASLGSSLFETAKKAQGREELHDCSAQAADE